MKINENMTFYTGNQAANGAAAANNTAAREGAEQRKTLFAGNLNQKQTLQDKIALRKAEAQKQAMKVVGDAFAGDRAIDEDLENRRQQVKELNEEKLLLREEAAGVAQRKEDIENAYESGELSRSDYLSARMDIAKEEQAYHQKLAENENAVLEENAIIRGTKQERLKSNPMGEAREQAENILAAAGDEIVGLAVEEAKEKLDKESEEREEQAAEIKEEREEKEALIEEQREHRKENEALLEDMPTEEILTLDKAQTDVKQEVQNIVDKMKLLAEDIKGAAVDEVL